MIHIPSSELHIDFVRSSGPGGQNVNKLATKAQLRWKVDASAVLSFTQKMTVHEKLANRINNEGEVVLSSDRQRSQSQNKAFVVHQLHELVAKALTPKTKRKPTKPSKASKDRRLESKKRHSLKKQSRARSIF